MVDRHAAIVILAYTVLSCTLTAGDTFAWGPGHATFYGGSDASGTNGGACGYQNDKSLGYGVLTAAISDMIYAGGLACGACFEVECVGSSTCYASTVVVTATNQSPQYTTATPGPHFDLSQPAFDKISPEIAGNIVIQYRRTLCQKTGGIKFLIGGQTYWMSVLVYNVGGVGDVQSLSVRGSSGGNWIALQHLWGQNWCTGSILDGQALSFATTTSDGKVLYSYNVASSGWQYGQTYAGQQY